MPRLHAVPLGCGLVLFPEWCYPVGDQRIVRPIRWKESRRARV